MEGQWMGVPDEEVVRAMTRGDRNALAELYDRYAEIIFSLVVRITRTSASAEDLSHDIFLELWRRADSFDPNRGTVRTWVVMRARSRALDLVRSAEVQRRSPMPTTPLNCPEALERVQLSVEARALHEALTTLPEGQRQVLELGYFGGLTSSEMAAELGVPVGTVKSRVAAALTKLRAILDNKAVP